MAVNLAELNDETRVACRAFMRQRFSGANPPAPITMSRSMGDGGGYGFNMTDVVQLLASVQDRLRALPAFAPYAAHIDIKGGAALPGLVSKSLSDVAHHAASSVAASLKNAGVELI